MSAVNFLALLIMFFYFRRRVKRELHPDQILGEIREETGMLLAELNKTTDRNINLMEEKIAETRKVLDEADQRITLLKRDMDRHQRSQTVYSRMLRPLPQPLPLEGEPASPPPAEAVAAAAAPVESEASALEKEARGAEKKEEESPDFTRRVIDLYRKGFSSDLIARELHASISEVELIVTLRGGE